MAEVQKLVHSFAEQINELVIYDRDLRHERVKPICFLLIQETRRQWQIFEVVFVIISDKSGQSVNPFHCKTYARVVFRAQWNIYNKAFL